MNEVIRSMNEIQKETNELLVAKIETELNIIFQILRLIKHKQEQAITSAVFINSALEELKIINK